MILLCSFCSALVIDPTNPVIYCNRAAAHSRLGDFQQAADDCKLALRYDPGYSKAYGRMGNAYSNLRRPELALDAYRNALRLDPSNPDYQHNLAVTEERLTGKITSIKPIRKMNFHQKPLPFCVRINVIHVIGIESNRSTG